MRVTCNSCGAKYTIADDKVRGRRVKVRCKGCGTPIVVDGNASDEAEPAAAEQRPAQSLSVPPPGKLPFEVEEGAPQGGTWSVNLSDTEQKDMALDEIVAGWKAGKVTTDAFVWKDGMDDWKPILEVPELASRLPKADAKQGVATPAQKSPAAAAKPAAARVAARPAADLFGRVEEAGSETETPLAAGAAPYVDNKDKATGARNENSVLFSLDSLKSAAAAAPAAPSGAKPGPKPKPPAKRPGMASAPDDPFGMNLGGIGGIGGGPSALFGGDANALLTAPAPEPPPPPKPIAVVTTDTSSTVGVPIEAPKKSKKVFVGVGLGVAALAVIGVVAVSGGKKDADAAAESASAQLAAKAPEKKPEEKPPEAKPEEKPAESAAPIASASAAPTEASKGAPAAKGVTGTGATAKKEPEKTVVKEQPSAGVASFDTGAAKAALSASAAQASSCKRPGGPTGSGKAVITFATSGRVTSANVAGAPFGGTAVGGCIASVFRRAHVPAFSGAPVTVSKSFTISP